MVNSKKAIKVTVWPFVYSQAFQNFCETKSKVVASKAKPSRTVVFLPCWMSSHFLIAVKLTLWKGNWKLSSSYSSACYFCLFFLVCPVCPSIRTNGNTTSELHPVNYTSIPWYLSVEEVLPKTIVDVSWLFKAKALCGIKMPVLCWGRSLTYLTAALQCHITVAMLLP